jgi:hypothetical protein
MLKSNGVTHLAREVWVGIHAPWISHLLFTDDYLILAKLQPLEERKIRKLIKIGNLL